jgi:hypothetical protein
MNEQENNGTRGTTVAYYYDETRTDIILYAPNRRWLKKGRHEDSRIPSVYDRVPPAGWEVE